MKVEAANTLYLLTVEVAELCLERNILFSVENPWRSRMWDLPPFRP